MAKNAWKWTLKYFINMEKDWLLQNWILKKVTIEPTIINSCSIFQPSENIAIYCCFVFSCTVGELKVIVSYFNRFVRAN